MTYQNPTFDKTTYWERRKKGLRGQTGYAIVTETIKDEQGNQQIVPINAKRPPRSNGLYSPWHPEHRSRKQSEPVTPDEQPKAKAEPRAKRKAVSA